MGINRYIVGCKCLLRCKVPVARQRINRYIVGCKLKKEYSEIKQQTELIDT